MGKYLGLDASTQSLSACLIDSVKNTIEYEHSINFDKHYKNTYGVENGVIHLEDGSIHSPPLMWAEALDLLFHDLRDDNIDLSQIYAISGSGQQHGTVYLNKYASSTLANLDPQKSMAEQLHRIFSRPTSPIWMDTTTSVQCKEIETNIGGQNILVQLTGNTAFERFSGPQIRKFFQNEIEAYHNTAYIGMVSSYMASLLTGQLVPIEPGDGSGTNLMDIRTRQWSEIAMETTAPGLRDKLLPIAPSDRVISRINEYFVAKYDFNPACSILPFSGDNPCSLIGLGLVEPGRVALSLGTSDTLFACMEAPHTSFKGEGCVFASPDGLNYLALSCFLNGSLARETVRNEYQLTWEDFTNALIQTPPGNHGAIMLPYFGPEIVPKIHTPNVIRHQLNAKDINSNVRAVVEAQAMSSKIHTKWIGIDIHSLSVTGGASVNAEILQIYANVHNCPVHRFETTNSAALGAALRALQAHQMMDWNSTVSQFTQPVSNSTIKPQTNAVDAYEKHISSYEALEKLHTR